ncbi:Origin recognition complex subunit 3 [Coemansia sp. Benny D115]|nr:Origin recognition complex subunit 3 [Coemansia sp. Benny D115]
MVDMYKPVDVFDSMTESTFILKPPKSTSTSATPKTKAKAKTKASNAHTLQGAPGSGLASDNIAANGGYVSLIQGSESQKSMELRQQLFKEMWVPLERHLIDTEEEVNKIGISEVCGFVDTSYKHIETEEKGQLKAPFAEIAAAVAFSGVNTGDHSKLFQSLQNQLVSRKHHVALLESQYCTSLPTMLKALLDQMAASLCIGSEQTGTRGRIAGGAAMSAKAIPYDMGLLRIWWEETARHEDSRVVVILQDFEGFVPVVVDDFIRIATSYCQLVPIVIVFGLATSYESIHQSLTKASISMLNVERFNLQRSRQCIDTAMQSIFVEGMSRLSFGAEAYKSLLDQFLLYNFSISGFVNKLKFAYMDFFYAQPLSLLAAMITHSDNRSNGVYDATVAPCPIELSRDQVDLIRMQRSVQRFLEARAGQENGRKYVIQALADDAFFQETVLPDLIGGLVVYRQKYCLGIQMIQAIQSASPETMQKPIRTLHYYGVAQEFGSCVHWKTLCVVVRKMKAPEMEQLLARLLEIVEKAGNIDLTHPSLEGTDIGQLLRQAIKTMADPEALGADESVPAETTKRKIRTRIDMENRPFLLFDDSSSDSMLRSLDRCSNNIEMILRACLSPYQTAPLHEVFYYRHSFLLDTTFSAQPRAAVQAALGKTHYYIDCDCCKGRPDGSDSSGDEGDDDDDDQRVMASMNDTSIAYRLHQECGRMINLYDWYMAFASVVEQEGGGSAKKASSQSEIQARFLRAVEELRFLGFIKSTQRKTDHVMRLTWGM